MIPPKPIGLFESRTENERLNTFNYRVGQETFEPTVNPIIRDKFFQMPEDVRLQNNIGINTNPMLMSLGCRTVQEANGVVTMGTDTPFDGSSYNITPLSWDSPLTYVAERQGFYASFKQPELLIRSNRR